MDQGEPRGDKDLAAGTRMIGNLAEKPTGTDEFPDCRF
jgi:hypothetical protein